MRGGLRVPAALAVLLLDAGGLPAYAHESAGVMVLELRYDSYGTGASARVTFEGMLVDDDGDHTGVVTGVMTVAVSSHDCTLPAGFGQGTMTGALDAWLGYAQSGSLVMVTMTGAHSGNGLLALVPRPPVDPCGGANVRMLASGPYVAN